jgi:hypothetical protein
LFLILHPSCRIPYSAFRIPCSGVLVTPPLSLSSISVPHLRLYSHYIHVHIHIHIHIDIHIHITFLCHLTAISFHKSSLSFLIQQFAFNQFHVTIMILSLADNPWNMKHETWNMKHDLWSMIHQTWDIWSNPHEPRNTKHEIWDMRHETSDMKYEIWDIGCPTHPLTSHVGVGAEASAHARRKTRPF